MKNIHAQIKELEIKLANDFESSFKDFTKHVEKLLKDAKTDYKVRVDKGSKYLRIVQVREDGTGGSVWGFVDKSNGDVLKADGFKKPAKHARGSIYDKNTWSKFLWTGPQYLR
jgi:hypothetical protein